MKVLLDTCVWGGAVEVLQAARHDVIWAGGWPEDPGDEELLAYAHREQRVLVTLDKDFGELAVFSGQPHNGIVRLVGFRAREQARVCLHILTRYRNDLEARALITAEPGRVRVRIGSSDESA